MLKTKEKKDITFPWREYWHLQKIYFLVRENGAFDIEDNEQKEGIYNIYWLK